MFLFYWTTQISSCNWTSSYSMLIAPFWIAIMLVVPSLNQVFADTRTIFSWIYTRTLSFLPLGKATPRFLLKRDVALAPPMDNTQHSLNAKDTRREMANHNKAFRMDEPTSSVDKHATIPQSVRRKDEYCNRPQKHQIHVAMQYVCPIANSHSSPD